MKIGYECWRSQKDFKKLVFGAIKTTIKEKKILATAGIQKFLDDEDGAPSFCQSKFPGASGGTNSCHSKHPEATYYASQRDCSS